MVKVKPGEKCFHVFVTEISILILISMKGKAPDWPFFFLQPAVLIFSFLSTNHMLWVLIGITLTHCILNRLTIYWKSPILILGMSDYEIYVFLEKNG